MKSLEALKFSFTRLTGRSGLVLQKYSPEILICAGIVGIGASMFMACKSTLKVEKTFNKNKKKIEKIHGKGKHSINYNKDIALAYGQFGAELVKLYGPAIILSVASIGCIISAHNILNRRNVALMAAYKVAERAFSEYRSRVVEEYGADKDRQFRYGIRKETRMIEETDANGKKTKHKEEVEVVDPTGYSQYARFFDEACSQWDRAPEYNQMFLLCQQNFANDLLHSRGHVFLNEIYDRIGVPRTQIGAIVGWIERKEESSFIDFGIFNENGDTKRFVNGNEASILLDFNVQGVIYDMI